MTEGGLRPVICLSEGGCLSFFFTPWPLRQELLSLLHMIAVLRIQLWPFPVRILKSPCLPSNVLEFGDAALGRKLGREFHDALRMEPLRMGLVTL